MATPKALSITVLDDSVSHFTRRLKSFFLLDVQEPVQRTTYKIKLKDLDDDLEKLFRAVPYENHFALHTEFDAYCRLRTASEEFTHIVRFDLLRRIISKIEENRIKL